MHWLICIHVSQMLVPVYLPKHKHNNSVRANMKEPPFFLMILQVNQLFDSPKINWIIAEGDNPHNLNKVNKTIF